MGLRKDPFVIGEYYHIYNRGNSKQNIFIDKTDYDRFVKLLYLCNSNTRIRFREDIVEKKIDVWDFDVGEQLVSIGAWVLMSNHFHLYLTPRRRLGDVGKEIEIIKGQEKDIPTFLHKLCTAYSMYFNKKYKRTGKLFEGTFKSVRSVNGQQAKYIFSYIHLNPVKVIDTHWKEKGVKNMSRTINFLNNYPWSSYLDYKGKIRPENKLLQTRDFPNYFFDKKVFEEEIFDWLTSPKASPWGR